MTTTGGGTPFASHTTGPSTVSPARAVMLGGTVDREGRTSTVTVTRSVSEPTLLLLKQL